jgi:hypothetical protein
MNMSMKDRTTIHEEIHGVHCMAIPETPRLLERSLKELDTELAKIHPSEKRAFCQASAQNNNATATATASAATDVYGRTKNYVDTDEFRSRFLRCELFDAKKAAHRLVNYLDLIAYCLPFENGSVVLHRPITLSDFNEAEHTIIRKGHMQLLPFRDRSGRRVLAGVASVGINFDFRTWVSSDGERPQCQFWSMQCKRMACVYSRRMSKRQKRATHTFLRPLLKRTHSTPMMGIQTAVSC